MTDALPRGFGDNREVSSLDATLTPAPHRGLRSRGIVDADNGDITDDGDLRPADVTAILEYIVGA